MVPLAAERVSCSESYGRILAEDVAAACDVPSFNRSPYDGYAFRAADTENASFDAPAVLKILEKLAAGEVSHMPVAPGTAVNVMTGAPVPDGADAVCMFEKTVVSDGNVQIFEPYRSGQNVIYAGEDVKKGTLLARTGDKIDPGLSGTIAAQNMTDVMVYKRPKVALISTGSELLEPGNAPEDGKVYNSNRFTLAAELKKLGCEPVYLGIAGDDAGSISGLIQAGLKDCDAVILTGGVSVGDYDFTPEAMEAAGAEIVIHGIDIKPGMACCYGFAGDKLIGGLSGNPASSLTNFHVVAVPALKRLCGIAAGKCIPQSIDVVLSDGFKKASPGTRFLRGRLDLSEGQIRMSISRDQGNVVLSSSIGADVMAEIPAGSGPVLPGTVLKAFLI